MHMQGTPRDMQRDPTYEDVVAEVVTFLKARVEHACQAGIPRSRIVIDPGIGFGKTTAHNLTLIKHVAQLREPGVPTLVGPSRKRFIGELLDIPEPSARVTGTVAVVVACVLAGIECLRVHDVKACRQAADLCAAISHAQ
jgi:dihydropteroate synthase